MICGTCKGARWVTADGLAPSHLKPDGTVCGTMPGHPCPACNRGPDFYAWNERCGACVTEGEFLLSVAVDDPDFVLTSMAMQFEVDGA